MSEQSVGLYGTFTTTQAVVDAINKGWPGIGAAAGYGITSYPYTAPHIYSGKNVDEIVEAAYKNTNFWWLDFWTVSGPSSQLDSEWESAGHAAGEKAAQTIMSALNADGSSGFAPAFVVIDLEGPNQPSTAGQFTAMVNGWASGIQAITYELTPALYSDQFQWNNYDLNKLNVPGFVAVSPIQGNSPSAVGSNLFGYNAYFGNCVNGSASKDVATIEGWGKSINTIQFSNSGDDCGV